jgi:H+/Cl- antiporter ClcA
MIFMSAALTTLFSALTMELLCLASGIRSSLFGFSINAVMPVRYMWSALIIGLVCGGAAIVFTKSYKTVNKFLGKALRRIPFILRIVMIFVSVSVIGLLSGELIGTGHHLVDILIEGHGVWYMLIIYLIVRSVFLMIANTQGVTGGLFIPSLAIGAMLGALCSKGMIAIGILPREYGIICVVIGMVSFLAASSRVPISALAFSLEALAGFSNFLPVAIGVAVAFTVIETAGVHSFNDTVVDMKIEEYNRGRELIESDVELVVQKDAFVIGKEIKDVLWPPNCVVIPVIKISSGPTIGEGDLLRVHCRTHHPEFIEARLEELLGNQYEG